MTVAGYHHNIKKPIILPVERLKLGANYIGIKNKKNI